jgi:predicted membrane channel-forming protein YqfA (hemolysin III family)
MKEIEYTFLGETWYLTRLPTALFREVHQLNDGEYAFMEDKLNTITFDTENFTTRTIRHELFHVYVQMCCVFHSDIIKDSFEEICSEIFARYGDTMVRQANEIYLALKE